MIEFPTILDELPSPCNFEWPSPRHPQQPGDVLDPTNKVPIPVNDAYWATRACISALEELRKSWPFCNRRRAAVRIMIAYNILRNAIGLPPSEYHP